MEEKGRGRGESQLMVKNLAAKVEGEGVVVVVHLGMIVVRVRRHFLSAVHIPFIGFKISDSLWCVLKRLSLYDHFPFYNILIKRCLAGLIFVICYCHIYNGVGTKIDFKKVHKIAFKYIQSFIIIEIFFYLNGLSNVAALVKKVL